jgi:hypothetical protein
MQVCVATRQTGAESALLTIRPPMPTAAEPTSALSALRRLVSEPKRRVSASNLFPSMPDPFRDTSSTESTAGWSSGEQQSALHIGTGPPFSQASRERTDENECRSTSTGIRQGWFGEEFAT